eukprot:1403555-Pyramimonas_sp.AAC.1
MPLRRSSGPCGTEPPWMGHMILNGLPCLMWHEAAVGEDGGEHRRASRPLRGPDAHGSLGELPAAREVQCGIEAIAQIRATPMICDPIIDAAAAE